MEGSDDPEVPKFIRDSLSRRQGLPAEEVKLPTREFEGPTPGHVQKAIDREKTEEQILYHQQRALVKDVSSKGLSPESARRLVIPVNEKRLKHQRLAKQLSSEFKVK